MTSKTSYELILKTNTMSTFKKAKVIMLPTNEKTNIINTNQGLLYNSNDYIGINQHLYIISDDEIKEGDWFINDLNQIKKCTSRDTEGYIDFEGGFNTKPSSCKKIIATTDTSLGNYIWKQTNKKAKPYNVQQNIETTKKVFIPLPQPSQQFIEKFIEEYNRGNVITDVLIEYELISNEEYFGNTVNPDDDVPYFDEKLKINPKNNTITIKKVKDSWNREEVIEFGNKVKEYCKDGWKEETLHRVFFEWDKWVEENL